MPKFADIVERPQVELGGRFKEDSPPAVRVYTPAEIEARNRELDSQRIAAPAAVTAPTPARKELSPLLKEPSAEALAAHPSIRQSDALIPAAPAPAKAPSAPPGHPQCLHGAAAIRAAAEKKKSKPGALSVDPAEIVKLKAEGLGNGAIAKQIGASKSAVQRAAAKLSVPTAIPPTRSHDTERSLIETVMRCFGPYSDYDKDPGFDEAMESITDKSYRLQAESEAVTLTDAIINALTPDHQISDIWESFHAILADKRFLEFQIADRERLAKKRESK